MQLGTPEGLRTMRDWVRWGASRFNEAGLCFGHGTDNALDESLALVLHALHLDHEVPQPYLDARLTEAEGAAVLSLFADRVERRVPAAYLIGEMRFAGLDFAVNDAVLIPRSPIAELIEARFAPWFDAEDVASVLDLGCGSGCIGIAAAYAFPNALVDLVDVSPAALDVAIGNIERHRLGHRVSAIQSDLFAAIDGERYDLIISNPPYVSTAEMRSLPEEFRHEPALGLEAGDDGLDIVTRILAQAADHLQPGGALVVEVGSSAEYLLQRYPDAPFLWLDFERGGDGVFLLTAEQVNDWRDRFEDALG